MSHFPKWTQFPHRSDLSGIRAGRDRDLQMIEFKLWTSRRAARKGRSSGVRVWVLPLRNGRRNEANSFLVTSCISLPRRDTAWTSRAAIPPRSRILPALPNNKLWLNTNFKYYGDRGRCLKKLTLSSPFVLPARFVWPLLNFTRVIWKVLIIIYHSSSSIPSVRREQEICTARRIRKLFVHKGTQQVFIEFLLTVKKNVHLRNCLFYRNNTFLSKFISVAVNFVQLLPEGRLFSVQCGWNTV